MGATITTKPTSEMIENWKTIFEQYKNQLKPNKKTAEEVIDYLRIKYPIKEITASEAKQVVINNIMMNAFAEKVQKGKELKPLVYHVLNEEGARSLYNKQSDIFRGHPIIVGVELESKYVSVEGSEELADDLVAFQGLDELDLNNYYLVANYVTCLQKYNRLESVLVGGL